MSQRVNHNLRSYSYSSTYDELRTFLRGPKYLLLFKLPFFLVGIVLYAAYHIVKYVAVQLIKWCHVIIKKFMWLIKDIYYYIILVCIKFTKFVQYCSIQFYKEILQPVGFLLYTYILPNVLHAITSIAHTFMQCCFQFYREIVQPIARLSYTYIIVPSAATFDYISTAIYNVFSLLVPKLRVAGIWIWLNIVYPLCTSIYKHILLPSYDSLIVICLFTYTQILVPLGRLLVYIARLLCDWSKQLLFHAIRYVLCAVNHF